MRCSMSLATACHPASRNPATTGTQESVCSLCGQLHIFSPPSKKKKKKLLQKSGLSPTPQAITRWSKGRAERLQGWQSRGGWVGRQVCGSYTSSSSSALRRETAGCTNSSRSTGDVLCCHFRKKENPEQI